VDDSTIGEVLAATPLIVVDCGLVDAVSTACVAPRLAVSDRWFEVVVDDTVEPEVDWPKLPDGDPPLLTGPTAAVALDGGAAGPSTLTFEVPLNAESGVGVVAPTFTPGVDGVVFEELMGAEFPAAELLGVEPPGVEPPVVLVPPVDVVVVEPVLPPLEETVLAGEV
jgi:hypothetical protein